MARGWAYPLNARKAHYFRRGISLCRNWGMFDYQAMPPHEIQERDKCKACARKAKKMEAIQLAL
jgi:hypothetical protein